MSENYKGLPPRALLYIRGNDINNRNIMALDSERITRTLDGSSGTELWEMYVKVDGLKHPVKLKGGDYVVKDHYAGLQILSRIAYLNKKRKGLVR